MGSTFKEFFFIVVNRSQQKAAEKKVLELEENKHYYNLSEIDLSLYGLHLKLVKHLWHIIWGEKNRRLLCSHVAYNNEQENFQIIEEINKLTGNLYKTFNKNNINAIIKVNSRVTRQLVMGW